MISSLVDTEWFYRILEIRKNPDSATKEDILKMADDLVLVIYGWQSENKIAGFAIDKASNYYINKRDD